MLRRVHTIGKSILLNESEEAEIKKTGDSFLDKIRFRCLEECSTCCERPDGFVFIDKEEALAAARFLNMNADEFLLHFTREFDHCHSLANGEDDHCVFLEDGKCLIYPVRPAQCRTYPFWPENLRNHAAWQKTQDECPGIGRGKHIPKEKIRLFIKENP
ncbi:MAG TPA: YkgJ family cysteine cluster protein [Calditrichaeota bacterium]|nr:YkgJ family cysteine cluster protein [Calditrichota bacterium]